MNRNKMNYETKDLYDMISPSLNLWRNEINQLRIYNKIKTIIFNDFVKNFQFIYKILK